MDLYGISREEIKANAVLTGDYYVYSFGERVEVSTIRKRNSNEILSYSLSPDKAEDKFMIKYTPNNVIYFDKDFVDSDDKTMCISCHIDDDNARVLIGKLDKYEIKSGVLVPTGILSVNGLVQKNRHIYYSNKSSISSLKRRINLLSVGVLGDKLYGVYHIAKARGIAFSSDDETTQAISTVTLKPRDCISWNYLDIEDWFENCQLRVKSD